MVPTSISGNKKYSPRPLRPWVVGAQVAAEIMNPAVFNMVTPLGLSLSKPDLARPSTTPGRMVIARRFKNES
ncbi:hypothetical protein CWO84_07495 [Methylomonas sp. Kb3]|nr:hypothetical protein CWO84_07495 [Methylomonas sp. Kb3]